MDALEAIHKRRSIRKYTDAPIPREDLIKIVDAGRMAATGHNRQPWDFIVITEREMIERLKLVSGWIEKAAAVIAVVIEPVEPYWLEDGSAAIQNMLVASTALGYGSCWLEGNARPHEETLKSWLGVPAEKRLLSLVPLGVAVAWPTRAKKPLSEVLYWEKY